MGFKERTSNYFENIPNMEKGKATKYIVIGIFLIIIFGLIASISTSIADNANDWKSMVDQIALNQLNDGIIDSNQYNAIIAQNTVTRYAMQWQEAIVVSIAKVGIDIALLLISIGFISFALNESYDQRTRWICLIISGVILSVILFTTLFTNISLSIA
ncbi:MAG: conserved membrane protein of unknown function [Promethearchaeota archaeon]|nr:MAG: conserved membrane protein of unknown function [Candidatus Lokiarchaeota archaeon]